MYNSADVGDAIITENVLGTILVQYAWQKYIIKEKKDQKGGAHKYKVVPDYFLDDVFLNRVWN